MMRERAWISSMKRMSPRSRPVSRPARSPAFSMVGPLVHLMFTPIACERMCARVVLPRPGGPLRRMCSSTSPRCRAASTITSSCSRTFSCPANSLNAGGRREMSNGVSGASAMVWAYGSGTGGRCGVERCGCNSQAGGADFGCSIETQRKLEKSLCGPLCFPPRLRV